MSDEHGTFEHADHTSPRKEHGYCTDDMARLLVVTSRETDPSAVAIELARKALRFVAGAQGVRGDCRNRRGQGREVARPLRRRGLLGPKPLGTGHGRGQQPP